MFRHVFPALAAALVLIGCPFIIDDDPGTPPALPDPADLVIPIPDVVEDTSQDSTDTTPDMSGPDDVDPTGDTTGDAQIDDADPVDPCANVGNGPCADEGATRCAPDEATLIEVCTIKQECLVWTGSTYCEFNFCTETNDVCEDSVCVPNGEPNADCPASETGCSEWICDPTSGSCDEGVLDDFTPCDDGDVCSSSSYCFTGECVAETYDCQKDCNADDYAFNGPDYAVMDLNGSGSTNVMNAYGCGDGSAVYQGAERVIQLVPGDVPELNHCRIFVELMDPEAIGVHYVDAFLMQSSVICDPSACVEAATMDDSGRAWMDVTIPEEVAAGTGEYMLLAVDGRDGYTGTVRVAMDCGGLGYVEGFCGDGNHNSDYAVGSDAYDACEAGGFFCDCGASSCLDAPLCGYEELFCADELDNDGDGAEDCVDSDCAAAEACTGALDCPYTIPLGCGDTLSDQSLEGGMNYMPIGSAMNETCPDPAGSSPSVPYASSYKLEQKIYAADPGGAPCYTITLTTANSIFDFMAVPYCDSFNGCIVGTGPFSNSPTSFEVESEAFVLVQEYTNLPTFGTYEIGMDCSCN